MWTFFINIGSWISSHWGEIVTFLSSTTTVGFITNLIMLRRQGKDIKANTAATSQLNESTTVMNDTKTSVDEMKASNEALQNEVTLLKAEVAEERTKQEEVANKLDSILDVMQVVYSTIKDETIRKTVSNIITESKFAATSTKVELEKQVEELKTQLAESAEKLKEQAMAKLEEVKTVATTKKSKQRETATRY